MIYRVGDQSFERTVDSGSEINLEPTDWSVDYSAYKYWKINDNNQTYLSGAYFDLKADHVVFKFDSNWNLTLEGVKESEFTPYYTVTYLHSDSDTQGLNVYYSSSAPRAYAQYSYVEDGYKFNWWYYKISGIIVYPEGTIPLTSTNIVLVAQINPITTPLILNPNNICVEKGGSYTLSSTAIGLDPSHSLDVTLKVVDSNGIEITTADTVGVYTITITVNSITDSTGASVENRYSITNIKGIFTIYGGEHTVLVT